MILTDVNVLVYAFRAESVGHEEYRTWLTGVVATEEFALVDACLTGFLRIVTNPKIYTVPAPTRVGLAFLDRLREAPRARPITATRATWAALNELAATDPGMRGNLVPDAYLAALALSHGAVLATNDRGFARFPGLSLLHPVRG